MNKNFVYGNVNDALPNLMRELLEHGAEFGSRAGATKELTFVGITLQRPWQREIVVPGRKASIAAQIAETMWVLSGRNDIAWLSRYLPRAADFSDDGKVWRAGYGPRLRNFRGVDQLAYVVDTLRSNPSSRQAVATIWDPTVDTNPGKDIACNNWLTFSHRNEELDLMVGIRSNDAMWGWSGINAFEWSALLEIVAGMCGMKVGQLHFAVTSFHLYEQHWEKAQKLAELSKFIGFKGETYVADSPRFDITVVDQVGDTGSFDRMSKRWFEIERRIRTGDAAEQDVDNFPEPMLQSWLRVIQWYWSGDDIFLKGQGIEPTRLAQAAYVGMKPAGSPQLDNPHLEIEGGGTPDMRDHIYQMQEEKAAAYGDSWKRRGEPGILGNIARKVDRIGSGVATSDETQADTAQDLLVYLALYRCWLDDPSTGDPAGVKSVLSRLKDSHRPQSFNTDLDRLFNMSAGSSVEKIVLVNSMIEQAYSYALSLW